MTEQIVISGRRLTRMLRNIAEDDYKEFLQIVLELGLDAVQADKLARRQARIEGDSKHDLFYMEEKE